MESYFVPGFRSIVSLRASLSTGFMAGAARSIAKLPSAGVDWMSPFAADPFPFGQAC